MFDDNVDLLYHKSGSGRDRPDQHLWITGKAEGKQMTISETITSVRYVTGSNGEKTGVLISPSGKHSLIRSLVRE